MVDLSKTISLTQGLEAIVDKENYHVLSRLKWHSHPSPSGHVYAATWGQDIAGKRKRIFMHRAIIACGTGMIVDHINGNSLDNREVNLRGVTLAQNMWNRKKNSNSTSKYKGVYWHKQHGKWIANIQVNKKRHFIGLFTDEDEAGAAYAKRELEEFGEYRRET